MRRAERLILLSVLALAFLAGSTAIQATAATLSQPAAEEEAGPRITGVSAMGLHGSMGVAERRNRFSTFGPKGWGTQARLKAAGDEWVHLAGPFVYLQDGDFWKPSFVVLCAQSTAGARTMPTRLDVWATDHFTLVATQIASFPIYWPATNAHQCVSVGVIPDNDAASVAFSLLLHFANSTDRLTLGSLLVEFNQA
jgi:hypothetical protein